MTIEAERFDAAVRDGVADFGSGLLVAALEVRYRRPIPWSVAGVRVEMVVEELRAASFRVRYRALVAAESGAGDLPRHRTPTGEGSSTRDGHWDTAKPAAEATTQLVPYDLAAARPRRLTPEERTFLAAYEDADEAR